MGKQSENGGNQTEGVEDQGHHKGQAEFLPGAGADAKVGHHGVSERSRAGLPDDKHIRALVADQMSEEHRREQGQQAEDSG